MNIKNYLEERIEAVLRITKVQVKGNDEDLISIKAKAAETLKELRDLKDEMSYMEIVKGQLLREEALKSGKKPWNEIIYNGTVAQLYLNTERDVYYLNVKSSVLTDYNFWARGKRMVIH